MLSIKLIILALCPKFLYTTHCLGNLFKNKQHQSTVHKSRWISLILLFLLYRVGISQYYPAKVYTTEDGIPSHSVFDIAQTPDNVMWFLSTKGVFNYDAVKWNLMPDSLALPSTSFSHMQALEDGSLWLAGQNNENFTVKYRLENQWQTVELPEAILSHNEGFAFNVFKENNDYHLLIGIKRSLYDIKVDSKSSHIENESKTDLHINSIYIDDGGVLLATHKGIFEYHNGELRESKVNGELKNQQTHILSLLRKNSVLYIMGIGWLGQFENGRINFLSRNTGITSGNFYNKHNLEIDSQKRLYFSSRSIPAYLDPTNGTVNNLNIKQVDFVFLNSRIFIDKEENVWIGDYRGLFKYDMSSFKNFNQNTGLSRNEVSALTEYNDQIVAANIATLNFLKNGKVVNKVSVTDQKNVRFLDLEVVDNNIYLAGQHGGLFRYKNGVIESLNHLLPKGTGVTALEIYKGKLHISSSHGVFRFENGKFRQVIYINGLRNLTAIGPDTLYLFTYRSGIFSYQNGDTIRYTSEKQKYNSAFAITKWKNDVLVGTSNGLAKISGGKLVPFEISKSLKYSGIYAFQPEGAKLWIGSSEGVHKWNGENLTTYDQQKGLLGFEVNRNAFMIDKSDNLWIGTESGLSLFPVNNRDEPKVNQNILRLEGKSKTETISANQVPRLKYNDNNITFQFIWPTFRSEQSTTYRYRLLGLEDEWKTISGENELTFTKLGSGQYKFEIQANLSGLIWSEVETLQFIIAKPFYVTPWFIILCIATFAFILYTSYRIRFNYLLKRQVNLRNMVAVRTKALAQKNNEIESQNVVLRNQSNEITEINKQLEYTIKDLKNTQRALVHSEKMASLGIMSAGIGHEINNPLNFIRGGFTILKNELSDPSQKVEQTTINDAFRLIDSGVIRVNKIVNSLNQFSRNSTRNYRCDLHEVIDNCLVVLHGRLGERIEVIKEYSNEELLFEANVGDFHQALLNVLTNSYQAVDDTGTIKIETRNLDAEIEIIISDTGKGLDQTNISHVFDPFFTTKEPGEGTGLGLSITYNIIKEHEGSIKFESTVNEGTSVIIRIPKSM